MILNFHYACMINDIEGIENIIDSGLISDINYTDEDGDTALHIAVLFNNYDIVHYLLNLKCFKNNKNNYGWTPMDIAIMNKDTSITQLLYEYGSKNFSIDDLSLFNILYFYY
jgi:ankyrin repeat protein